jgi:hypothetical protein
VSVGGILGLDEPVWDTTAPVVSGGVTMLPEILHRPLMNGFVTPVQEEGVLIHRGTKVLFDSVMQIQGVDYNRYVGEINNAYVAYTRVSDGVFLNIKTGDEWLIPNGDFQTGDLTNWTTTEGTPTVVVNRSRGGVLKNTLVSNSLTHRVEQTVSVAEMLVGLGFPADCHLSVINDPLLTGFGLKVTVSSWSNSDVGQYTFTTKSGVDVLSTVSSPLESHDPTLWTVEQIDSDDILNIDTTSDFLISLYGKRNSGNNSDAYMTEVTIVVL